MATNVNYEDERFGQVDSDIDESIAELEQTYGDMSGKVDEYYQEQIDATKKWEEEQKRLQQEQTDFTIEQIEQQKHKTKEDYLKEQSGAFADWKKQSNQYGVNAEQQAGMGMAGTGFSESSQVGMYNTYQNRVATARESYNQAVLNYNNAIKDARLQNNSVLAEIAFEALQQQLQLSLEGFQYKNQLILEYTNKKIEMDRDRWNRYQDVLNQINTEKAFEEDKRQFDLSYEQQQKAFEESIRQFNQNYELNLKQFHESIRQFDEEIARLKAKDAQEYQLEIQQLELQKKQMEEAQRQWEAEMALRQAQLEEEKRQYDLSLAEQKRQYNASKANTGKTGSNGAVKSYYDPSNSGQVDKKTPTNNMDSIIALGYGPISAAKLAQLVSSGQVVRTLKNGQYYYSKKSSTSPYGITKNFGYSK